MRLHIAILPALVALAGVLLYGCGIAKVIEGYLFPYRQASLIITDFTC